MDDFDRKRVLDRAEGLLPKYGGFAWGALNQAVLLEGVEGLSEIELSGLEADLRVKMIRREQAERRGGD